MSKIQIAPSLLFQYSVKVLALEPQPTKLSTSELPKQYALPNFARLNTSASTNVTASKFDVDLRMAWASMGIWMQAFLTIPAGTRDDMFFRVFLDTRGAIGNKRLTQYCHQFNYKLDFVQKQVTQNTVDNNRTKSNESSAVAINPLVDVQFDKSSTRLLLNFPADALKGFQPREFPQISYFCDLWQGSQPIWNAGTDPRMKYDIDPSVWIRCQLV